MYNIDGASTYVVAVSPYALISESGYSYAHSGIEFEQLCEIVDAFTPIEDVNDKTQLEFTDRELTAVLQLINNNISDRKCDENELGYMGLLDLKNKLQK